LVVDFLVVDFFAVEDFLGAAFFAMALLPPFFETNVETSKFSVKKFFQLRLIFSRRTVGVRIPNAFARSVNGRRSFRFSPDKAGPRRCSAASGE
jgi:hypothetical protein